MHSAYSLAALIISRTLSGQTLTQVIAEQKIHPSINSAAIRDLSSNALRYLGKSTFIIQKLSKQHKRDQEVDALLHIGISQISLGKPPYAIVNSVVEACNTLNKGWAKSYINAMLRNYLRQKESLDNLCYHNEVSRYNHPIWWINELKQDWPDDWISILTANQTHPPMTLRVNRKKISPEHYAHMLDKEDIGYSRFINDAIILEKPRSVQTVPGFQDGLVSVQDASAQWAAYLLDVLPEHRVLDACCAPGGKAAHILELSDADLTALDLDTKRIKMTESTFNRLGLRARLIEADACQINTWWDQNPYDRILADVPCSASGIVRRHPDIKWNRTPADIVSFTKTQAELLDALWNCLAIGGKLLYATCSIFKKENTDQTARFLQKHRDARLLPLMNLSEKDKQLLPNDQQDGFYYALFERNKPSRLP